MQLDNPSTHPDNPFLVSNEVTTRTDSRHFDSPAERRLFEDVAGVSGNRCTRHGSSVSNEVTTRTDSRHFDVSAERRLFEDVAGVSGNRCIKHGSSSTVVDWQTTVGVFLRPGYQQKYLPFPSVARNERHAQRVPSDVGNGQSEFGGDTMRRSGDIRARAEASAIGGKWRRCGKSQEDDSSLTFDPNEFDFREPNLAEIGLAVFEKRSNRRTHRQTDRQIVLFSPKL